MKEAKEPRKHAGGPIAERELGKWIGKAKTKFIDRFDYSKVSSVGFHYKAEINAKCMRHDHGEFVISAKNFMRSEEPCVKCHKISKSAVVMTTASLQDRKENWLKLSKGAHVDEAGEPRYDYSNTVFTKLEGIVSIRCPSHGIFKVKGSSHARDGKGCPDCLKEHKTAEFIKAANKAYAEFYDYSESKYETAEGEVEVVIRCPLHGLFKQIARNHTRGRGCISCGNTARPK